VTAAEMAQELQAAAFATRFTDNLVTITTTKASAIAAALRRVARLEAAARQAEAALEGYATCCDGCTCGDGWSHASAVEALAALRAALEEKP